MLCSGCFREIAGYRIGLCRSKHCNPGVRHCVFRRIGGEDNALPPGVADNAPFHRIGLQCKAIAVRDDLHNELPVGRIGVMSPLNPGHASGHIIPLMCPLGTVMPVKIAHRVRGETCVTANLMALLQRPLPNRGSDQCVAGSGEDRV